ncbi:MAG: elongation factor 1-alpha C-terminal domain-related protein, partial [Bradyrhizobium sp.]
DAITVLPSGRGAKVARIVTWDADLNEATSPISATLALDREVDISRGDLIVASSAPAMVARRLKAAVVWMDRRAMEVGRRYLLKHTSQTVPAFVTAIEHRSNLATLAHESAATLRMNDIGVVAVDLLRPIAIDAYGDNRATGAFILIDMESNATVAAGMVKSAAGANAKGAHGDDDDTEAWRRVTAGERQARWGHRGGVLELTGSAELIDAVERSLFSVGVVTGRIEADEDVFLLHPQLLEIVTEVETRSGLLSLVVRSSEDGKLLARAEGEELKLDAQEPMQAVTAVHQLLYSTGIFISSEKAEL